MSQQSIPLDHDDQFPGDDIVWMGTSSFSEKDWVGVFYPEGTKARDYLPHYAKQYRTVEIDASYYGIPRSSTVDRWAEITPDDFLFAAKFPKDIVHAGEKGTPDPKKLLNPDATYPIRDHFLATMDRLGSKRGPMLIQFPYFNKKTFPQHEIFLEKLDQFLADLPRDNGREFAIEIRNKTWLSDAYFTMLRDHGMAAVMVDQAWMPHGDEMSEKYDALTADWTYVRLLGDRKKTEDLVERWDKEVLDYTESLTRWAKLLRQIRGSGKIKKILVYANNHYAGHAPATLRRLNALYHLS
jgi:uncharacterized protein YecE (DUF72 family)